MAKRRRLIVTGWILMVLALIASSTVMSSNYIGTALVLICGLLVCVYSYFEGRKVVIERVVLIALLSALATAGRVLFMSIPSVQPASFIIIVAGIVFGKEIGLMTGAITALASNMILGQGPWTPWQMFLWGAMGFLSALLASPLARSKIFRAAYGFIWGFVFGLVMNLWYLTGFGAEATLGAYIAACATSISFDAAHAVANAALLLFAAEGLIKTLSRIALKYKIKEAGKPVKEPVSAPAESEA